MLKKGHKGKKLKVTENRLKAKWVTIQLKGVEHRRICKKRWLKMVKHPCQMTNHKNHKHKQKVKFQPWLSDFMKVWKVIWRVIWEVTWKFRNKERPPM